MAGPAKPELSLVVCTYRRPAAMAELLAALGGQTRRPDEVLVVDASPDAETEEVVRSGPPLQGLRYEKAPPEHRGLTRQRNYGVARTKGEVVAFLDDDAVPAPDYCEQILACFERHPDAVGVGGFVDGVAWRPAGGGEPPLSVFRLDGWERREDLRWRLRRILRLDSARPPGWMPSSGHGRPVGFLPPDGEDHTVESLLGCAMAWRRRVFDSVRFSSYFEGYGLYEDLDFCIRAARLGPIVLCTRARLRHEHAPAGRPDAFRYGMMVVRNGWFVWRRRWPQPRLVDQLRWWATTLVLAGCRLGAGGRRAALLETLGRLWAVPGVLLRPPRPPRETRP
jgi:GT2 family glycosyltransferase